MHAWANELKAKTDAGAFLFFDGELWRNPEWTLTEDVIFFTSGNCSQILLEPEDDPGEAELELRGRLLVLVPA